MERKKLITRTACYWMTILIIVAIGFGFVQLTVDNSNDRQIIPVRLVLGPESAAASETIDYVCDGVADNAQFAAALAALPATGGEIHLLTGTYDFAITCTRAIDDVKITGTGWGTVIGGIANPPITAGGDGWQFRDLKFVNAPNLGATTDYQFLNVYDGSTGWSFRDQYREIMYSGITAFSSTVSTSSYASVDIAIDETRRLPHYRVYAADFPNPPTSDTPNKIWVVSGDAQSELEEVLTTASTDGGAIVEMSTGSFTLTDIWDFSNIDDVIVQGSGKDVTTIYQSDKTKSILYCTTPSNNLSFRDMELQGYNDNNGTADSVYFVYQGNSPPMKNIEFRNIFINYCGPTKHGFNFGTVFGIEMTNIWFDHNGGALKMYNNSADNKKWGDGTFQDFYIYSVWGNTSVSLLDISGASLNQLVNLLTLNHIDISITNASTNTACYFVKLDACKGITFNDLIIQSANNDRRMLLDDTNGGCQNIRFNTMRDTSTDAGREYILYEGSVGTTAVFNNCDFNFASIEIEDIDTPAGNNSSSKFLLNNCSQYILKGNCFENIESSQTYSTWFDSLDGASLENGDTTSRLGVTLTTDGTGTDSAYYVRQMLQRDPQLNYGISWEYTKYLKFNIRTDNDSTNQRCFFGIGSWTPSAETNRHAGIIIDDADIYMSCADGTVQNTVDSGINIASFTDYPVSLHFDIQNDIIYFTIGTVYTGSLSANTPSSAVAPTTHADYVVNCTVYTDKAETKVFSAGAWELCYGS